MTARKILITGATGKQGGAAVKALLGNPPSFDYEILAVTRNVTSNGAKKLAENSKISIVQGDLNDCETLFKNAGGANAVWGVFCVTLPDMSGKDENKEAKQGIDLVDAAVANGVKHFVYTSVDRGGSSKSDADATYVPHFASKYKVEIHLKEKAQGTDMTYTILRPVAFMDNLIPGLQGRMFAAAWHTLGNTPLQLVAVKDIGQFAALAFAKSDTEEYKNRAISLAGCDLTQEQANEIFWTMMGRPMPRTYDFVANGLMYMVAEVGTMFKWFKEVQYGADVDECMRLNKDMLDFAGYLREESGFKR
jgi:uncharacterized protein YbjT (DUF2867 family)